MRAALYLRQSQDRTGEEAGVTRQREDCAELAQRRGWTVVQTFPDNDVSGKRTDRPGFRNLLTAVRAGDVEAIVATEWTRLSRNRRDELALIEACQQKGVIIALVRGSDLDLSTAAGRMVADMMAATARMEIDQKSERQARAELQRAQQGRRSGGRRPFGYDDDGMTVREDEALAVKRAYADLLAGVPLAEIARQWVAAGLYSGQKCYRADRRGQQSTWARDTVRKVLLNPRNAGLRAYRGEIVAKAVWPAIVSEETWRAAVDVLEDPSRKRTPTRARFLLTGVALCGRTVLSSTGEEVPCDATVHGGGARRQYRTYRCRDNVGHIARMADPIERYVSDVVIERLSRPDAADLLLDTEKPDLAVLREKAVAYRARLDTLAVEFADGDLTASQLRIATERIRTKLAETEAEMASAGRVDILGPLVRTDDVRAVWKGLSTSKRRAVIATLMDVRIHTVKRGTRTFRPESVEITWKSITG